MADFQLHIVEGFIALQLVLGVGLLLIDPL